MGDNDYGIATIDPGIQGTGMCVWGNKDWKWNKQISEYKSEELKSKMVCRNPLHVENFLPESCLDWVQHAEKYHEKTHALFTKFNVRRVYCEFPQYFQSSIGHAATAKGDIHKLAFLVGAFAGCSWEYGCLFEPVFVNEWKGQLPKAAVIDRIRAKLPTLDAELGPSSHSYDAIGIGLWKQGLINR